MIDTRVTDTARVAISSVKHTIQSCPGYPGATFSHATYIKTLTQFFRIYLARSYRDLHPAKGKREYAYRSNETGWPNELSEQVECKS